MADQIKTKTAGEVSSPATEVKAEAPKRKEPIFADTQSKNESAATAAKGGAASAPGANEGNSPAEKKKRPLPVFADEVNIYDNGDETPDEPGDEEIGAFAVPITVDASDLVDDKSQSEGEQTPMGLSMPSGDISIEAEYPDPTNEDNNVAEGLYGPVTLKNNKYNDPGRIEAEILLADYKADKIARKERKANKGNKAAVVPAVVPVDFPDFTDDTPINADEPASDNIISDAANSNAYAEDVDRVRAETMLADHKAEAARKKAIKNEKRNQKVAPEAVVEDKEYDVSEEKYDEPNVAEEVSAAPLTAAVADEVVDNSPVEVFKEEPSTDAYDKNREKKHAKKEKKVATSVAAGIDSEYDDIEAYEESATIVVADPDAFDEKAPKVKKEISTDAYDDYLYEKDLKARKTKALKEQRIAYDEVNYFNDGDPMGAYPMDKEDKKQERIVAKERAEYIAEAEEQAMANDWWGARGDEKSPAKEPEAAKTVFVPVPVAVSTGGKHTSAITVEEYSDYSEGFDEAAYYAESKAKAEAKAKEKAEAEATRTENKAEKAEAKTEKIANKYDATIDNDNLKADKKDELLTHGKADIKEHKTRKAEEKAEAKAERLAAKSYVAPMPIYADHTENFDKAAYDAEKQAIADAEAKVKADAKAAKAEKKAEKAEAKTEKIANKYDAAIDGDNLKADKKDELLTHGKADIKEHKTRKAEEKAEAKAERLAAKSYVAPMPIYADHTENFDKVAYDAEKQAIADAQAQVKAEAKAAKAEKKAEKAEAKTEKSANKYDAAIDNDNLKADKKDELLTHGKADIKEQKARKAEEKAEAKAERLAAKSYVAPMPIYADHTENFDKVAYDAEKQAIADAQAQAKAERKAEKLEKKAASEAKAEAKIADSYDESTGDQIAKMERKSELASTNKQAVAENKAAKVEAKAERKAAKIAAASVVPPVVLFSDYTENFDKSAYDADKQKIAAAEAKAKAEAKAAKLEKKAASEAKAEAKVASSYDKATGEQLAKMERKSELASTNKQAVAENKAAKVEAKAERKAAKLAAASVVPPAVLFSDYAESFDKEAYDAEKQAVADAQAQAKAERKAEKLEKKAASEAKAEAKIADSYDKATGEQLAKMERKSELASTNKQAVAENKAAKVEAKAEAKAAKLAAASVVPPAVLFSDYAESFDKEAYDAEKQAVADAQAQAKAERKAEKLEKKAASEAKAEAKIADSYDKATGEQIAKMERKSELASTNKQAVAENKAAKVEAKAEAKAAKIAAASVVPPVVLFSDYTENFDKSAYDAEKQAVADAQAQAKAERKAEKLEKKAASEAKAEAKIADSYDKATGEQLAKMERKSELASTNKQAVAENKAAKVEAKAEAKAAKLAAASVVPPAVLFSDYAESFDKEAYDAEKQAVADAQAQAKAERKAEKLEKKAASEAKAEAKIADSYDKATGEQIAKMERKSELASTNKQAVAENKAAKVEAKAERQAAKLAAASVVPAVAPFNDFTESFNKAEYDLEKTASAESLAAKKKADADNKQLSRVAAKNQKDVKATELLESKFANGEMLDFAKTYRADVKRNKKQLVRSEKYGKFMLEYGSTYDPEWDGEFNNYGLPEKDTLTEGVKLSTGRNRSPKREKLSGFNASKLTTLARMQRDTDNQMVVARVQSEFADLELEVAKAQQDFAGEFRSSKEKRWLRNSNKKLGNLRAKIALAEKYERFDNDRYYSVVTTNFDTVALPSRADRNELIALREELMRLLDIRDEINAQLIQLYTGTEKDNGVNHIKHRNKVVLKARKRAHAKYRKHYNALNKYHVTRNEKMRIFDKLDEIVELSGELARIKYILKKEKPIGKARRECIREKGNAKSNLRYAKKYAERFTVKAVRRAKIRKRRNRALVTSLVLLALLGAGAFALYLLGPQLLEMVKPMIPEQFRQYIDMILGAWPKK